jgi:hypothetical protein
MDDKIKKSMLLTLFILFLCFIITEEVLAQDVTLRYGHLAGTTLHYALTIDNPSPQGSMKLAMTIDQDVTNVDVQGIMNITYSFNNATMLVNGTPYPYNMQGQVLSSKMSRRGEAVVTNALGQFRDLLSKAGFSSYTSVTPDIFRALGVLEFPEQPVSPGDTWSVNKNQTFTNGDSINITYTYTLESFVTYEGYDCAQIKIESQPQISLYQDFSNLRNGTQVSGQIKVLGTLLFAHNEGRIVKIDETVETSSIGNMIAYNGIASVVPVYQKTSVSLKIQ